jgi:hypothetical protein
MRRRAGSKDRPANVDSCLNHKLAARVHLHLDCYNFLFGLLECIFET